MLRVLVERLRRADASHTLLTDPPRATVPGVSPARQPPRVTRASARCVGGRARAGDAGDASSSAAAKGSGRRRRPAPPARRAAPGARARRSARAAPSPRWPRSRRRPAAAPALRRSPDSASQARCLSIAATTSSMPSPRSATSCTTGGARRPGAALPEGDHGAQLAGRGVGAVAVGLVDDVDVADLEDPGLGGLDAVAHARAPAARRWCRPAPATSTSLCPTPTVSTRTTSQPAASSTRSACGVAQASPPRCPREAIERM